MTISLPAASLVFALGLCVGSFLNVCIWRLPAGEQVVRGRSRCRSCGKTIRWYDNLPVLSFLALKGRCRFCRAPIARSYPVVELAAAGLLTAVFARFGFTAAGAVYGLLAMGLIVLAAIDWREMVLPDELTLPGLSLGVILSFYVPQLHGSAGGWAGLREGVIGALTGAGVIAAIRAAGTLAFRRKLKALGERQAMGFGDVKLMAMIGAFIGWKEALLVNLLLAPVLGSAVGVALKLKTGKEIVPYGPFLAAGALISVFWGKTFLRWYGL